jgi:hypothetical protein
LVAACWCSAWHGDLARKSAIHFVPRLSCISWRVWQSRQLTA